MSDLKVRRWFPSEVCGRLVDLLLRRLAASLDEEHPDVAGLCAAIALLVAVDDDNADFVSLLLLETARAAVAGVRGGRLPADVPTMTRVFASNLLPSLAFLVPSDEH